MKKESKIGKSVRLSKDQIAYIEEQEGKDFSAKLSGLLEEVKSGETKRKERIAWYEGMIREQEKELNGYRKLIFKLHQISRFLSIMEKNITLTMNLFPLEDASADTESK